MYATLYMALGVAPSKTDFLKQENFEEALAFLKAPEAWLNATMTFIKQQYEEMTDPQVAALCAYIRFIGVAELGHERKVFDRPFWLPPPRSEVREEVSHFITIIGVTSSHSLTTH
jgi:hypothetical protein